MPIVLLHDLIYKVVMGIEPMYNKEQCPEALNN